MKTRKGFTLIELLVVISIIALLIGILLPALGAARRAAAQMKSNTQVRGIHQTMIIYAQSNNSYYPGMTSKGAIVEDDNKTDGTGNTLASGDGGLPAARYAILFRGNYFTGEYAVSPAESATAWTTGTVDDTMFSYAMLQIDQDDNLVADPGARPREWKETLNSEAPVITDRNTGSNDDTSVSSIHTELNGGEWRGSVAYNDGHVSFETTHRLRTKFTGGAPLANTPDNLFNDTDRDDSNNSDNDAAMVFSDVDDLTAQRP